MKTVKAHSNPEINLKISQTQFELIEKLLICSKNCFDKDDSKHWDYVSNENFICTLTEEQFKTLQKFTK